MAPGELFSDTKDPYGCDGLNQDDPIKNQIPNGQDTP